LVIGTQEQSPISPGIEERDAARTLCSARDVVQVGEASDAVDRNDVGFPGQRGEVARVTGAFPGPREDLASGLSGVCELCCEAVEDTKARGYQRVLARLDEALRAQVQEDADRDANPDQQSERPCRATPSCRLSHGGINTRHCILLATLTVR